ncbi:MAG TPA: hypothetical protein VGQ33_17490 [Vicinamibacteria bacterium]|nr:hypothetical protein [Vicinamibacteria bacterium]
MTAERSMFDFLRARGEEYLAQISNELMANPRFIRAMQTALRGKEWVDQAVAQALRTMNVPTRTEFKRAVARIEVLERELADAKRQAASAAAAPAPRPRAAKAPAPKPKKKTRARPARKPAARTPAE